MESGIPAKLSPTATNESVQREPKGRQSPVQMIGGSAPGSGDPSSETVPIPATADEFVTRLSSSSGSVKPQSLDGKSIISGTTFALDEKESLRPDDSASVEAAEDEDAFLPPSSEIPGSRPGSDDDVRAFRDQLREISSMEPQPRPVIPQVVSNAPKGVLYVPPPVPDVYSVPTNPNASGPDSKLDLPPDPKLLEALDSPRDRIWVLKLEQDIIDFVKDAKEASLNLPQCNSFYRMLAHKIADYYMLGHVVDDSTAAVRLYKTATCRIPAPLTGITTPSTAASTPPPASAPQMKILRRGGGNTGPAIANRSSLPSKTTSESGENSNEEDKKSKMPATREEREARYEAARLRIMGSAKPSESPEAPKEKQESRSSSTNGKKNRKKTRAESDDDFEARSAYSNFYATSYSVEAPSSTYQGFPDQMDPSPGPFQSGYHNAQQSTTGMHHAPSQGSFNATWGYYPSQSVDSSQMWSHNQYGVQDLSAGFNRTMSFSSQTSPQTSGIPPYFNMNYNQQYYTSPQGWPQNQYPVPPHTTSQGYGYAPNLESPTSMYPSQMRDNQPYQYGQLPSQAYPGRPQNRLEHPLPGSYKGKNFNPQSQSFVPGTSDAPNVESFSPIGSTSSQGFGLPPGGPPQVQPRGPMPLYGYTPTSSSQHSSPTAPNRIPNPPMTHPLPQPVFPLQPSLGMPLPSKPGPATSIKIDQHQTPPTSTPNTQSQSNQSVVAKWGMPASLPAKPPPSTESFDAGRFAQPQRQPQNIPTTPRRQSSGFPTFGSAPQISSTHIVNGTGTQAVKR